MTGLRLALRFAHTRRRAPDKCEYSLDGWACGGCPEALGQPPTRGGLRDGKVPRLGVRAGSEQIPSDDARVPVQQLALLRSPLPGQPDAELLNAVAAGDGAALSKLYDLVMPRVYGLILKVVRDRALAEEVAQEVIIEVWRSAGRFDAGRGSVTGWVFTIAHRRAVDRVRAEQAHANRMTRVGIASHAVAYDAVVDEVIDRLSRRQVRDCLDCLTDLQRQVVTLAFYDGHTYREVAALLNVPLPTVKTRMRDGLIRLRDCLGPQS